ncbi:MAG: ATP-dependent zinc protease [Alphaproteobacteria bacterium]|nr:ATP-dependent zinc protease [Alphaproteobacteria bacterium]
MSLTRPTLYPLPLIGWREEVSFPDFGSGLLVAKVDTGARSAALHAEGISIKGKKVSFTLQLGARRYHLEAPLIGTKRVKSSNGISELRPIVDILIQVGSHQFDVETTLTDRADMGVPMLLGRQAIKGHFLVHPGRSFILSRAKKKLK